MRGLPGPGTEFDERGLWPSFAHPRVGAFMSTRLGGVSSGSYASFNVRPGVGDDEDSVVDNRRRLAELIGVPAVRVDQVHGVAVHRVVRADLAPGVIAAAALPVADATFSAQPGVACEIHVADCLPVLFADVDGRVVGAAHAGWRGLAGGVLEACLDRLCEHAGVSTGSIEAWLGPCIGAQRFEVGLDVLRAFGATAAAPGPWFKPRVDDEATGPSGKWWADLAGLARQRLMQAGVYRLGGNDGGAAWCTASDASRYFSYRRDRRTGRMAALIWLKDGKV